MYEDIAQQIEEAGADRTYLTMSEAGAGLAEHVARELRSSRSIAVTSGSAMEESRPS